MTIRNYTHPVDKEWRDLYTIRYEGVQSGTVQVLAQGLDDAVELFCAFFKTGVPNPQAIPDPRTLQLSDLDKVNGKRAIVSIERMLDPILYREEERKK